MFTAASVFDRRLVDEHDRNVVLDRVDPVTGVALEPRAVVHEAHRSLALRTDEAGVLVLVHRERVYAFGGGAFNEGVRAC